MIGKSQLEVYEVEKKGGGGGGGGGGVPLCCLETLHYSALLPLFPLLFSLLL